MWTGVLYMYAEILLLLLILIGLLGKSPIIATAACSLLIVKLTEMNTLFKYLDEKSLEFGLLFLTIAVLVPFANGNIGWKELKLLFTTWVGLAAFTGGALATYLNGEGLYLLQLDPELILGLVLGSIFGIVFLQGVPVGPLMAAGITFILLKILELMR